MFNNLQNPLALIGRLLLAWLFRRRTPGWVDGWSKRLQLVSASAYALGHGGNDAQKTIGIIWMLLIAAGVTTSEQAVPSCHHHFYPVPMRFYIPTFHLELALHCTCL